MVHDAVGRSDGVNLSLSSFKSRILPRKNAKPAIRDQADNPFGHLPALPTLKEAERQLIQEALQRAGGNQGIAAGLLGLSRTALNRRINREDED